MYSAPAGGASSDSDDLVMSEVVQVRGRVARRRVAVAEAPVVARAPRPRAAARRAAQVVPTGRVAWHLTDDLVLQTWHFSVIRSENIKIG